MIHVDKNISIKEFTTFRLECIASHFVSVSSVSQLIEALEYAKKEHLTIYVLGGGSNILFSKPSFEGLIIKMDITGHQIEKETDTAVLVDVGAGESWDLFVENMVNSGYRGVEALSFIPGTVGATPVQNVGAYGVEVKDVIDSVKVYNTDTASIEVLKNEDCLFSYRDSIFKKDIGKKYIILSVLFLLEKNKKGNIPKYPGVINYFEPDQQEALLEKIREVIITIRTQKLPHPKVISSCGSFFKNPIITKNQRDAILATHPQAVLYDVGDEMYKIGAGWLIDTAGLKGKDFGTISIYPHNALVVVNTHNNATYEELQNAVEYIQTEIYKLFGITLEMEPIII